MVDEVEVGSVAVLFLMAIRGSHTGREPVAESVRIVGGQHLATQVRDQERAVIAAGGRVLDREPEPMAEVRRDQPLAGAAFDEDLAAERVVGTRERVVLEEKREGAEILVRIRGRTLVVPAPRTGVSVNVARRLVVELAGHVAAEVEQVDLVVLVRDRLPHAAHAIEPGLGHGRGGIDAAVERPGVEELRLAPAGQESEQE
jgi:hypothetical protein